MPFMVAVLAATLIGERVGLHRLIAIAAGFLGVFIMLQKGADWSDPASIMTSFADPAAILAFLAACSYACGQLLGRKLGPIVPPAVTAFYQNLLYLLSSLALALLFWLFPPGSETHKSLAFLSRPWIVPPEADYCVLLGIAVLGAFAIPLFASAYKHADASFVAPFEYTSMFWAVLYGVLIFGDFPGVSTWVGAAIVVAAGLVMLAMDRRRAAVRAAEAPT
jgi:drug/metabolite transporter (DMT)-like permease